MVLAGNWQFICYGGKYLLRPEKKYTVVCLVGAGSLLRPEKKVQLSVWRVRNHYYDWKIIKIQSSVWRVRNHVCLSCRDRYICISST